MPKIETKVSSGTTYNRYASTIEVFSSVAQMKAFKPPKGADMGVALVVTLNGTSSSSVVYVWDNDDATSGNDTTVVVPTGHTGNGRWLKANPA